MNLGTVFDSPEVKGVAISGDIPGSSTLIFDIELLGIS